MEQWKDVAGYEGLYQVSSLGRVRSLDHIRRSKGDSTAHVKGKIRAQRKDKYGYMRVNLCKDGVVRTEKVHTLVCAAFHENPENKPTVNHINCNRSDNRADNLEWATVQENTMHGYIYGKVSESQKKATEAARLKRIKGVV